MFQTSSSAIVSVTLKFLQDNSYIEDITWRRGEPKFLFECWRIFHEWAQRVKYFSTWEAGYLLVIYSTAHLLKTPPHKSVNFMDLGSQRGAKPNKKKTCYSLMSLMHTVNSEDPYRNWSDFNPFSVRNIPFLQSCAQAKHLIDLWLVL